MNDAARMKKNWINQTKYTMRRRSSASWSKAPARIITKFVPSPTSCSCICEANMIILAAGCSTCERWRVELILRFQQSYRISYTSIKVTSSSLIMVAASLVTKSFSIWLIIILFMPFGPYALRTVSANFLQASILRYTASSSPEKCCNKVYTVNGVRQKELTFSECTQLIEPLTGTNWNFGTGEYD